MLKKWREERQAEAARKDYEEAHARWAEEMAQAERLLGVARTRQPTSADEAGVPVMLKKDEGIIGVIESSALVEPRRLPGQWQGGRQGVSFRVAKGVTVHAGGTRGTYQQGEEVQKVIDPAGRTILTKRGRVRRSSRCRVWWKRSSLPAVWGWRGRWPGCGRSG